MTKLLHTYPDYQKNKIVSKGNGSTLYFNDGSELFDMTGGWTSHCIVGWSNPRVIEVMKDQIDRICHIDYKVYVDQNREKLSELLLSQAEHDLDRVYFSGNSGGEACEAAMKLSYQAHYDSGKQTKNWFISREQSYHGSSTDALSVGDRPNLKFLKPLYPNKRVHVPEQNPYREMYDDESEEQYARRSADELEKAILEIGSDNVAAFIAETIQGGLVGFVPPAKNYWKYVREICDRHDVHLILDEVICGTGTSGKIYCCDWDQISPDFLFLGKTLASGYCPISIVLTHSGIEDVIRAGQGRIQHSTTHQGHSLGTAAALAVQTIIHESGFLDDVNAKSAWFRQFIERELSSEPFFRNIRGRGLRLAVEYDCPKQNEFGIAVSHNLLQRHNIIVDGKWHRFAFSPMLTITEAELFRALTAFVDSFKTIAKNWD